MTTELKNPISNDLNQIKSYSHTKALLPIVNFFDFLRLIPFKELMYIGVFFSAVWLYVFFNKIDYLPSFDLNTIAATLIGLAFIGVFLIIVMASFFLFPSLIMQAIHTEVLGKKNDLDSEGPNFKNKLFNYSIIWQFFTSLLFFTIFLINQFFREGYAHMSEILLGLYSFLCLLIALQARFNFRQLLKQKAKVQEYITHNRIDWGHVFIFMLWSYFWMVFFVLFAKPIASLVMNKNWAELLTIGIFAAFFGGLNFVAFYIKNKSKVAQVFIGLMLFGIFASLPINMSILEAPFRMLNLGDVRNAKIIIKPIACDYLNALQSGNCTYSKENKVGVVQATIVSRIGSEYLLKIKENTKKSTTQRLNFVPIPKADILVWSQIDVKQLGNDSKGNIK